MAPYLALLTEEAGQRRHDLCEVLDALRRLVQTGSPWRLTPHDLPPGHAACDQARRWMAAGRFEAIVHDLRAFLRIADGRRAGPTAAIIDSRTLQSSAEGGPRAGCDGCKRRKGSKVHLAVDTPGRLPPCTSRRPTSRTGPRSPPSATPSTRRPASRSS